MSGSESDQSAFTAAFHFRSDCTIANDSWGRQAPNEKKFDGGLDPCQSGSKHARLRRFHHHGYRLLQGLTALAQMLGNPYA